MDFNLYYEESTNLERNDYMKELKNPYDYDLSKLETLFVSKDGTITGGTSDKNYKTGTIHIVNGEALRILGTKKIFIVEEVVS